MMIAYRALFAALVASSAGAFLLRPRSSVLAPPTVASFRLFTATTNLQDTPTQLPEFINKDAYLEYMESVAALPQGFATGTADAKFISVEAPGMGPLPIRGTVIHLTNGPTDSWAAVFTKNKVRFQIKEHMLRARLGPHWSLDGLTLPPPSSALVS